MAPRPPIKPAPRTATKNPAAADRSLLHKRLSAQAKTLQAQDIALARASAVVAQQTHLLNAMAVRQQISERQIQHFATLVGGDVTGPLAAIAEAGRGVYERHLGLAKSAAARLADIRNPAQPVPEPAPEAPVETEQQAMQPAAIDDVSQLGASPVTDVSADDSVAVDEPYGTTTFEPLQLNELDVTAPVQGTQTMLSPEQVITDVEVRVGNPDNPQPAFGWTIQPGPGMGAPGGTNGPSVGSGAPTTRDAGSLPPQRSGGAPLPPSIHGSRHNATGRTMAAIQLARLRIEAQLDHGSVDNGDDLVNGARLEHDATLSDEVMASQIQMLSTMKRQASSAPRSRSSVPRSSSAPSGERLAPSLAAYSASGLKEHTGSAVSDEEFLFG